MFVEEFVGSIGIDRMGADEPFDFAAIADAEFCVIKPADFTKFVAHFLIGSVLGEVM